MAKLNIRQKNALLKFIGQFSPDDLESYDLTHTEQAAVLEVFIILRDEQFHRIKKENEGFYNKVKNAASD